MKLYDIAVKVGTYKTHDGTNKNKWQNVGAVFEGKDGGQYIMMSKWFSPAGVPDLSGNGSESILMSMFPPKERGQAQASAPRPSPQQAQSFEGFDEDIPF